MVATFENPFVFDRPLTEGVGLVGRSEEFAEVSAALRPGGLAIVEGPHRHGKTSLVNATLAAWTGDGGGLAVDIDCSGVLTAHDLAARLRDAFVRARAQGAADDALVERLETLSLRARSGSGVADPSPDQAEAPHLMGLLSIPGEVCAAADTAAAVCFDEFQDAAAVPGVLEVMREAYERERGTAAYVFAGPDLGSLTEHAEQRLALDSTPVTVRVGTVDPESFANDISRRFAETDRDAEEAAEIVARMGAGHPQRTSQLAWHLWELTPAGERASARSAKAAQLAAIRQAASEFDLRWHALHGNERRVAVALAHEIAPQGTRAQRATGLSGFGAAQRAVQGVKSSGVAQLRDDRLTLTDPLFAQWLRLRYSPGTVEQDWQSLRIQHSQRITRGM